MVEYIAIVIVVALGVLLGMAGYMVLAFAAMGCRRIRRAMAKWSLKLALETQELLEDNEDEES